jgi:voltage-gated potassium channel
VSVRTRLAIAGLLFLSLFTIGTVGLHAIEGISAFDALYQTVVTIATAGVAPAQSLTVAGKFLTITLLLLGGGLLVYCVSMVMQLALEGQLTSYFGGQRMRTRIEQIEQHFIVCGYGRVGEEVAAELAQRSLPFVLIELAPETAQRAAQQGHLIVEGDATQDAVLERAGITRARCLIAVSNSDANNTYLTLSARALNPGLFIVARTSSTANDRKLMQAGADRVISPYSIAGRHIALTAIQPLIVDFGETPSESRTGLVLAQIAVGEGSDHHGRTVGQILAESRHTTALGLHRASGALLPAPDAGQVVSAGDELIVFGPGAELEQIMASPAVRTVKSHTSVTPA